MFQQANLHDAQAAQELCKDVAFMLKLRKYKAEVYKNTVEIDLNDGKSLAVEYDVHTENERHIGDGRITPIEFCFDYKIELNSILCYDEEGDLMGSLLYNHAIKKNVIEIIEDDNVYEKYYEDAENKHFG